MREKDEMPFFNHNSSGISFLLISLTIYLWHSTGKNKDFFSPSIFYILMLSAIKHYVDTSIWTIHKESKTR